MRASIWIGLSVLLAQGAAAAVQDEDQRRCLSGFEKAVAGVVRAAGKSSVACLRDAARGRAAFGSCVADDPKATLARAETALEGAYGRLCAAPPAGFPATHRAPPGTRGCRIACAASRRSADGSG